jgi:tRNA(Ile2) C34 agmatinyltransferase TiaS
MNRVKLLTFDQGTVRDLHNAVVDLIEAISIHDNGENCPYCGNDYIDVGGDQYRCPDVDCTGNVAFDLIVKVRNSIVYRDLEGFKPL